MYLAIVMKEFEARLDQKIFDEVGIIYLVQNIRNNRGRLKFGIVGRHR